MGAGYRKKRVETLPTMPEPANEGLRILAKMIVQSLLRQQAEGNHKPEGAERVEMPPESTP